MMPARRVVERLGGRRVRDPRAPAGVPSSAPTRSSSWSGILPSSGTSSSSASSWPPPSPKIVKRSPSGVVKPDMFSITPAISRSKRRAVSAARLATFWAAGCGVVTITNLRLRQQLGERHRHVAGARRQVDQQVVELAPVHVLEELADRLVQHRAAPGDRLVLLVEEELDRDHLHAAVRPRAAGSCARPRPSGARARRACAGSSSPTRRRRARPRRCPRPAARRRGWR